MVTFITGNAGKFAEASAILEGIEVTQTKLDLPEIQDLDPNIVLREKLLAAKGVLSGAYVVEDSSLTLSCLGNALPGPFIKWFEDALSVPGIYELTQKCGDNRATIHTHIGFMDEAGEMHFFSASMQGTIVAPRGDKDFGYGPIFLPDGSNKTFGEMEREEKYTLSSRGAVFRTLKHFLAQAKG